MENKILFLAALVFVWMISTPSNTKEYGLKCWYSEDDCGKWYRPKEIVPEGCRLSGRFGCHIPMMTPVSVATFQPCEYSNCTNCSASFEIREKCVQIGIRWCQNSCEDAIEFCFGDDSRVSVAGVEDGILAKDVVEGDMILGLDSKGRIVQNEVIVVQKHGHQSVEMLAVEYVSGKAGNEVFGQLTISDLHLVHVRSFSEDKNDLSFRLVAAGDLAIGDELLLSRSTSVDRIWAEVKAIGMIQAVPMNLLTETENLFVDGVLVSHYTKPYEQNGSIVRFLAWLFQFGRRYCGVEAGGGWESAWVSILGWFARRWFSN